jgi:indolepyruvate ferredoxin oxidoreductase
VAEGLFRAMAIKDEYEVARMHAAASYGPGEVFYMAPPLISRVDPETGRRRKVAIPGWAARPLFAVLRHGKKVRGTALDLFGRQEERQWERELIGQYREDVRKALAVLGPEALDVAMGLAEIPDLIRGYGPVKEANRVKAMERRAKLLERLGAGAELMAAD